MKMLVKFVVWGVSVFVLGGIGGVFVQQTVVPWLAAQEWAQKLPFVRTAQERTTIIERTENVQITEDDAVRRVLAQVRSNIVLVTSTYGDVSQSGSGIFVTGDGLVAVAGDVIMDMPGATTTVFFATGESVSATLAGVDRVTGIAFVRVDGTRDYPVASFARTQDLSAGQRLIEVGVDAGVDGYLYVMATRMQAFVTSVASGTSDKWSTVVETQTTGRQESTVVVTDRGELAALGTTAQLLPADAVRFALERLVDGRVDNVVDLGIVYRSVTPMTLTNDAYGYGVVVESVVRGGRGSVAGLRVGDHIIALDGKELSAHRTLPMVCGAWRGDQSLEMTVVRGDETVTVTLTPENVGVI